MKKVVGSLSIVVAVVLLGVLIADLMNSQYSIEQPMAVATEESYQHVVALELNWDAGYVGVPVSHTVGISESYITLQLRDGAGSIVAEQSQPVFDCEIIREESDIPGGRNGSAAIFTVTLPYEGYFEEWARGVVVLSNGVVHTFTVPGGTGYGPIDPDGFTLMGVVGKEWDDDCPSDPPPPTLLPTEPPYPIQLTYTPMMTPTCEFTATPLPPQETYTPRPPPTLYPTSTPWPTQRP